MQVNIEDASIGYLRDAICNVTRKRLNEHNDDVDKIQDDQMISHLTGVLSAIGCPHVILVNGKTCQHELVPLEDVLGLPAGSLGIF